MLESFFFMQVGVKFYSTNEEEKLEGLGFVDFVEVLPVPGKFESLRKFKKFRCTVHVPHCSFGFNPCDKKNGKKNRELSDEAIKAADFLNAEIIVMHPGYNPPNQEINDAMQNQLEFFSKINDERIFLENTMIESNEGFQYVGSSDTKAMKEMLEKTGFGFCLDFAHAAATAVVIKRGYKELIKEFLKLKPAYFHVADNLLNGEDQHIHIGTGKLDMSFIKEIVKKGNNKVLLETPLDLEGRKRDVEFLRN